MDIFNISIDNLERKLVTGSTLLCCASFEPRCLSIPLSLSSAFFEKAIIFRNASVDIKQTLKNAEEIKTHFENAELIKLPFDIPVYTAGILSKCIFQLSSGNKTLVIDITTFTHEVLMILLRLVQKRKKCFNRIICLYNGASAYSIDNSPEEMWLSKGCKDVRTVFGYPGVNDPSLKGCLVLLTGFELERATKLISLLEPDTLAIGSGIDPICDNHLLAMKFFAERFERWEREYKNSSCMKFNFSCSDINAAMKQIRDVISTKTDHNFIIVPLNTKLSTVAAALVALEDERVQVCYAIPEAYNYEAYSKPSDFVTMFDL